MAYGNTAIASLLLVNINGYSDPHMREIQSGVRARSRTVIVLRYINATNIGMNLLHERSRIMNSVRW